MDRLLTVADAAEVMGVHPQTVYRLIWDGALPWVNVARQGRARIRIRQSALAAYLASRERGAAA